MSDTLQDRTQSVSSPGGEEELRFIRNFHDVFLSIGLGMLIVGIGIASSLVGGQMIFGMLGEGLTGATRGAAMTAAVIAFIDAAIIWALAEVFARTRRLFLPAIVILLGFIFFFTAGAGLTYVATLDVGDFDEASFKVRMMIFVMALAATVGTFAYYTRMKLPFAMGLGGAALAGTAVTGIGLFIPDLLTGHFLKVMLFIGVFLFLFGVYFDARDPARRTRLSDNGFWLHFFAAPLIFVSVTRLAAGGDGFGSFMTGGASSAPVVTLIVVLIFALISLLINRRALLVSGLISAVVAVSMLVQQTGMDGAWTAATTLLILGGAMVLLGGGWHTVRGMLVSGFPKEGLMARIIPPETGPNPRDQVVG